MYGILLRVKVLFCLFAYVLFISPVIKRNDRTNAV